MSPPSTCSSMSQPGGGEHFAHRHIVGVGDGPESREAVADRQQRQSFQEQRAQAMPVEPIVHGHGYFGLVRVSRMIGTGGDDTEGAVLPAKGNHGEAAPRVGWVAECADHLGGRCSFGEKPVASGFRREAFDEALQFIRVGRLRDAQEGRRAVA
jgi:hypothetical protein